MSAVTVTVAPVQTLADLERLVAIAISVGADSTSTASASYKEVTVTFDTPWPALAFDCTHCGATAGERCVMPSGKTTTSHAVRSEGGAA